MAIELPHRGFARCFGAQVFGRRIRAGFEGADVNQAGEPGHVAGGDDFLRQLDVGAGEIRPIGLAGAGIEHAHQVDHGVLAAHEGGERGGVVHVGFYHVDGGQRQQMRCAGAMAGGHGDAHPA